LSHSIAYFSKMLMQPEKESKFSKEAQPKGITVLVHTNSCKNVQCLVMYQQFF